MDCAIDRLSAVFLMLHALNILQHDGLSIFVGVFLPIQQSHYSCLCTGDILDDHLDWLLTVFIEYLEFVAEVVEDPALSSPAIGTDESDIGLSADFVHEELLLEFDVSGEHYIIGLNDFGLH